MNPEATTFLKFDRLGFVFVNHIIQTWNLIVSWMRVGQNCVYLGVMIGDFHDLALIDTNLIRNKMLRDNTDFVCRDR